MIPEAGKIDRSAPLAEMRQVTVRRGGRVALQDVSLTIAAGQHVAILGPNGSGKSTLMKTICLECYPVPQEGCSVMVFGQRRWNTAELRNLLGIVASDVGLPSTRPITGREAVLSGFFSSAGLWPHHRVTNVMQERADQVLRLLEVAHLADRKTVEMSSGEIRRILIARALVHDPRALVLDEPSNSLDLFAQDELRRSMRKLAQSGIAILLVTHQLADIIPEIDRVIVMREGRVVADGSKRQLFKAEYLTRLFGVRVELATRDGYYHAW
jgi:iron complex transport system ATP-binding protein